MRNEKLYACALLVLLLTALRLCWPVQAGQAVSFAARALDPEGSCRSFARTLGQGLDGAGLRDGLIAVFRLGEEAFG